MRSDFVITMTTIIAYGLEPKEALAHVTFKQLEYGMKISICAGQFWSD